MSLVSVKENNSGVAGPYDGLRGCDEASDQYLAPLLCSAGHVMLSPSKLSRTCLLV